MDLRDKIRDVQDFPKKGILFRDITPVLLEPEYFKAAVDGVASLLKGVDFDLILAPESRGFIFGAPLAYALSKGFVPVRKAGKLPYDTISESYSLEYGEASVEIHTDAVKKGQKVVIIDDLLATGGTAGAICKLAEKSGGQVAALVFLIELAGLNGREALKGYDIKTVITY